MSARAGPHTRQMMRSEIPHEHAAPLDAQARGGGGAAERLHASSRHVLAPFELEGGERTEAAQSSSAWSVTLE
jgi:hypothetical protein